MKRNLRMLICIVLAVTTLFTVAACDGSPDSADSGNGDNNNGTKNPPTSTEANQQQDTDRAHWEDTSTLVVYFSLPETTDPDDMTTEEANSTVVIDGEVLGNTQYMAYVIQDTVGANIFRIIPEKPYPTDHDTLVDKAAEEQNENARPAIRDVISADEFAKYTMVFIGYPNWWGDMPMIMYTFFETYDFSGKTIIPFNTHGGSGFSGTVNTIRDLEPNADVDDGMSVSRNRIQDAEQEVSEWAESFELPEPTVPSKPENDVLIVYFSKTGTTENVAKTILGYLPDADIFEVERAEPYPDAYTPTTEEAREELDRNARPELAEYLSEEQIGEYETILFGFPIWWHQAPMPMFTFLEHYDLNGKTIVTFCTSASSSISETTDMIRSNAVGATVIEGKRFSGNDDGNIMKWLIELGLLSET